MSNRIINSNIKSNGPLVGHNATLNVNSNNNNNGITLNSNGMPIHKRAPSESLITITPNIHLHKEMTSPLSFSTSTMKEPQMVITPTSSTPSSPSSPIKTIQQIQQSNRININNTNNNNNNNNDINNNNNNNNNTNNDINNNNNNQQHKYYDEEDESSSSEEEYEEIERPTSRHNSHSSGSSASSILVDSSELRMSLLDLGDNLVIRLMVHLHADDLCNLARTSHHFASLIMSNMTLWRELNIYYVKTLGESLDVSVWEEELHQQAMQMQTQTQISTPTSSKEKQRSTTFSTISIKKGSVLDFNSTLGKRTSKNMGKDQPTISAPSTTSPASSTAMQLASSTHHHVMIINGALRKLTPLTSVPSTDEITEFVDTCHTHPQTLLLRKLIQRYIVPKEFTNCGKVTNDTDWKKFVETPIQLRVLKLLKRVVDHKSFEITSSSTLILMTFIRGYLLPTSEMAKGLTLTISKKLAITKRMDITKLSESLLCKIFRNLDFVTAIRCLRVCRKWLASISNSSVWDHIYKSYTRRISPDNDINIWKEISPLNYLHEINLKLTPVNTPVPPTYHATLPPLPSRPPTLALPTISSPPEISSPTSTPSTSFLSFSPIPELLNEPHNENVLLVNQHNSIQNTKNNNNNNSSNNEQGNTPLSAVSTPNVTSPIITSTNQHKSTVNFMNLNQLVEKLTSITIIPDVSEINACLATYRSFTTTSFLVSKLLQRYHVPLPVETVVSPVEWKKKIEQPLQHHVLKVLKRLVDEQFDDFDPKVVTTLIIFLRFIVVDNTSLSNFLLRSFIKKVYKSADTVVTVESDKSSKQLSPNGSAIFGTAGGGSIFFTTTINTSGSNSGSGVGGPSNSGGSTIGISGGSMIGGLGGRSATLSRASTLSGLRARIRVGNTQDLLSLPAEEIAKQLTLMDFEIYSKIQTTEFLNQVWVKEKSRHLAPNVRAAIERFNNITKWVCTILVKEEKIRARAKYMGKLLKIARYLRSISNYHTLMAILSGLNEAPIFRLKHTFNEMKPKIQKLSSELQALMTVEGNHDTYRTELASIDLRAPCIPYLGVFLKDITFFQEGGQSSGGAPGSGINLKQSKNVYGVLKVIRNFQKNNYPIEENPRLRDYLSNLIILPEDELYRLSSLREPRNCKRADLI